MSERFVCLSSVMVVTKQKNAQRYLKMRFKPILCVGSTLGVEVVRAGSTRLLSLRLVYYITRPSDPKNATRF
jgi:hypothetical protein